MKFAMNVLLGILLLGSYVSLNAQSAGTSQVVMAYVNEPTSLSPPTPDGFDGVCLIYYTLVGDLDLKSLFALDAHHQPVVDRAHAHFIWVSDYKAQGLSGQGQNALFTSFLILEGTATIYYTDRPDLRNWNNRSTWGDPVAKFVRKAGMFQSMDGGYSGTLANTAELVSSKPFKLNGKTFDLKNLIPQGMTCFENLGVNGEEAGSCIAVGGGMSETDRD
jgi:hypothetical protein